MRLEKDDPRIIDFALGELDAEEHQQIAEALEAEENAAARAALAEFQKVIGATSAELAKEDAGALGAGQKEAILARADGGGRPRRTALWLLPAMAAAGVLLIVVFAASNTPQREAARRMAALPAEVREQMEALGYLGDNTGPASELTAKSIPVEHMQPQYDTRGAEASNMIVGTLRRERHPPPPPMPPPPAESVAGPEQARVQDYYGHDGLSQLEATGYLGGDGGGSTIVEDRSSIPVAGNSVRLSNEQAQELEALGYLDFDQNQWDDLPIGSMSGVGSFSSVTSSLYSRTQLRSESYAPIHENPFKRVTDAPLSTFSIDVDTASYSNVRRFLTQGQFPPPDAVRIEELLNYFDYDYPHPEGDRPFAVDVTAGPCPWRPGHMLAKIGLQGYEMPASERPRGNFVFLLDVSGSMNSPNKLPLVKESMRALLGELRPDDRVGIVTYSSNSSVHLASTRCDEKEEIEQAIESLSGGGSTHGSAGIRDAYKIARRYFVEGGVNRVILATDGDFNVGVTNHEDLMQLIEGEAKSNVFLTALGFGMGNIKDHTLEQLADRGNGHYAYIDDFKEARKALVVQLNGAVVTIAKDVKIQVEFNPAQVGAYRLIGYENRVLAAKDFNDDTKDAGEIGAGHTVTALYEIVPPGASPAPGVDPLKYQDVPPLPEMDAPQSDELMTVKLRWKAPEGDTSQKIEVPVRAVERRSRDLDFAASVAGFGMLLRGSQYSGNATWTMVRDLAEAGQDDSDTRKEYLDLVIKAKTMAGN